MALLRWFMLAGTVGLITLYAMEYQPGKLSAGLTLLKNDLFGTPQPAQPAAATTTVDPVYRSRLNQGPTGYMYNEPLEDTSFEQMTPRTNVTTKKSARCVIVPKSKTAPSGYL